MPVLREITTMSSVSIIVLCASALFVQTISGQCLRAPAPAAWSGCGAPAPAPICGTSNYGNIIASNSASSNGGGLDVIVSSPLSPSGISVLSDNDISGMLAVSGNLPVLAAVALDGSLPTGGSAGTTYSCGSGQVGMSSDSLSAVGLSAANNAVAFPAGAFGPGAYRAVPCGCY